MHPSIVFSKRKGGMWQLPYSPCPFFRGGAIEEVIKDRRKRRLESQPLNYPSAGSVFRNPDGMSAWKLIDEAGLKGYSIGGAKVSEKHANFIINYDHATGEDIKNLIEYVQEKVKEHCQVELKVEQEFVNWE